MRKILFGKIKVGIFAIIFANSPLALAADPDGSVPPQQDVQCKVLLGEFGNSAFDRYEVIRGTTGPAAQQLYEMLKIEVENPIEGVRMKQIVLAEGAFVLKVVRVDSLNFSGHIHLPQPIYAAHVVLDTSKDEEYLRAHGVSLVENSESNGFEIHFTKHTGYTADNFRGNINSNNKKYQYTQLEFMARNDGGPFIGWTIPSDTSYLKVKDADAWEYRGGRVHFKDRYAEAWEHRGRLLLPYAMVNGPIEMPAIHVNPTSPNVTVTSETVYGDLKKLFNYLFVGLRRSYILGY